MLSFCIGSYSSVINYTEAVLLRTGTKQKSKIKNVFLCVFSRCQSMSYGYSFSMSIILQNIEKLKHSDFLRNIKLSEMV